MKIVPLLCLMCAFAGSTFSLGVTMRTDGTSATSTTGTVGKSVTETTRGTSAASTTGKSVTETTQGTSAAASTSAKGVTEKAEGTSTSAAGTSTKGIAEKAEAISTTPASSPLDARKRLMMSSRVVFGGGGFPNLGMSDRTSDVMMCSMMPENMKRMCLLRALK